MPFRRFFLLLHRAGVAQRLLIQSHQLLCLGVKILSRRGQHHPAGHVLEQLELQLPFQRADLLRSADWERYSASAAAEKLFSSTIFTKPSSALSFMLFSLPQYIRLA